MTLYIHAIMHTCTTCTYGVHVYCTCNCTCTRTYTLFCCNEEFKEECTQKTCTYTSHYYRVPSTHIIPLYRASIYYIYTNSYVLSILGIIVQVEQQPLPHSHHPPHPVYRYKCQNSDQFPIQLYLH